MTETNQYLYKLQATRPEMIVESPTSEEEVILDQHFDYLQDLLARGMLILAGRTLNSDPTTFGIVIFIANSLPEAVHIMDNDPAIKKGVMQGELFPYRVAFMGKI